MIYIANWKMYGNLADIKSLKNVINLSNQKKFKKSKIIYCPPFTLLDVFIKKTKNSKIIIGAQNCHFTNSYGAFTGSINSKMIKNIGAKYVILGHSECRQAGDTNTTINKKIISALSEKLNIIFCIGETLDEKKKGNTKKILKKQISIGLSKVKKNKNILIAYEPRWAIGTGITPRLQDLEKTILEIKKICKKMPNVYSNLKILYGGSVNNENSSQIVKIPFIQGLLIGKASLNSKKFIDIIKKTII